ncbi:MAG: substrate-binding domain-containing protein [Spirochaetaceae bacterium]|jgi:ribose transport system substrate-binding protein|nr:substrate-binding domain-containing protein [Spirochaetaceae bacterium]
MNRKNLFVFCLVMALFSLVLSCKKQDKNQPLPAAAASGKEYPPIDFKTNAVFGIAPNGQKAGSITDVQLSDEEKAKIRKGNYTAAFCYHQLDNQVNQSKLAATRAVLADLNIKVLSVTDAQSQPDKLVNDLETTLALKPDILFSMPYEPNVTAAVYRKFVNAGTKIVFMENTPTGFDFNKGDYVTMTNSDSYGNGKYAADIMAREIGYAGEVAMVFFDAVFFTTNERDRAFRETIANNYPDIKIVGEYGFTSIDVVGASADALFAAHPKVKGIYASWDIPAEDVMASALAVGRNDLVITCVDLGEQAAVSIAKKGIIRGLGAPRAVETGTIEGLAAGCALIGKKIPGYIVSASQPVARDSVLDSYKICYNIDAPKAVVDAFNSVK